MVKFYHFMLIVGLLIGTTMNVCAQSRYDKHKCITFQCFGQSIGI